MLHLDVRACDRFSGDDQVRHICDVPRHNKWLKAISNLSQTNALHAASCGVAQGLKIVGRWQWDVKPDSESNKAYSPPSKLATMRDRWAGPIMLMNQLSVCSDDRLPTGLGKYTGTICCIGMVVDIEPTRTRCIARLRGKLRGACRRERVDTGWLAALVASACREISLHLSALRLLVPFLLVVPAFAFEPDGWFLIFLLALAALLGFAFAFAFVELSVAAAALPFLTAADVHCVDLH